LNLHLLFLRIINPFSNHMKQSLFNRFIGTPATALMIAAFMLVIPASAQKTEKENLQNKKKNLESEINNTNKLLDQTKKAKQASLNQLALIEGQIENQQQMVGLIQEEVVAINNEMTALIENIRSLEHELDLLKKEYAEMIYFSYLTRSSHNKMMFIFASESMNEAYQRYRYLQEYANSRKRQAELIVGKQEELRQTLLELDQMKTEKFNLLKQQESEVQKLNTQKKEKDKTVQELKAQEQKLKDDIRKKQKEAEKLQKQIEQLILKEMEAANKKPNTTKVEGTSMPMTTTELEISKGFSGNKGKLPWPVDNGMVTGKYGEHPHPVLAGIKVKNNGIDVTTKPGTLVKAVFEGSVSAVFTLPNGSKAVIIRHGEYLTVYTNIASVKVKKDDKVSASTTLGTVYTDASDNTTIFHFEVWKEKALENPEYWLRKK
jgi:murein hydrolase activator